VTNVLILNDKLPDRTSPLPPLSILGEGRPEGAYILRLTVRRPLRVVFGRFRGGRPVAVPAGECLYVGSAMGGLGRRLVRHATRTDGRPPHPIRAAMLSHFPAAGLGQDLLPRCGKSLRWHVDYLLDDPAVALCAVIVLCSGRRLEAELARLLQADPHTFPLAAGLGASDSPGNTHLLGVRAPETWWASLPETIDALREASP